SELSADHLLKILHWVRREADILRVGTHRDHAGNALPHIAVPGGEDNDGVILTGAGLEGVHAVTNLRAGGFIVEENLKLVLRGETTAWGAEVSGKIGGVAVSVAEVSDFFLVVFRNSDHQCMNTSPGGWRGGD